MATQVGGTRVRSGYYLNTGTFGFANVEKDGAPLPGGAEQRWRRIPTLAVMLAAPALGGLFVVALPFIGVGVAAQGLARSLTGKARAGARELAATVATPGMAAGQAALTGQPALGEPGDAAADENAEELAKEIEAQRGTIY